ncbi:MAG: DNA replication/repair protein RecF [Alphaproteobacteria bacterium]|nr:DNA replication/repair protein RecF [Alphaproteobacteria bacterium]
MKVPETQRDTALDTTVMAVTRLRLTDFRSYDSFRFDGDSRPVVLTGPNGAGKTNLLEAVSYLAPGRGLRGARLSDIDRRYGKGGWAVAATVQTQEGSVDIGTGRDAGNTRRTVRISNNPAQSQAALAEFVSVVWLTPQMDRLFTDGASARRRFLDRLVYGFDPSHASRVNAYDHAMRERLRLLKAGRRDSAWLSALENAMVEHGVAVAAARLSLCEHLSEISVAADGPFPRARIAAAGVLEDDLRKGPALAAEDRLRAVLAGNRGLDAESGRTTEGAHRSDLAVAHIGKDMPAELCSTGEQKALLIAIVLAHARLLARHNGVIPLLLLDEVAAHLDVERRHALFADILEQGAQAWLTGADATLFDELSPNDAAFYRVQDASMTPLLK